MELKDEIRKNCDIQLVLPDNHRRNLAERAIQTFKCHFKAVLAGVDDSFPMRLWDNLLPQTVLTLNLLRQFLRTNTFEERLIIIRCHWHQWDVLFKFMKAGKEEARGLSTRQTDGILKHQKNITVVTKFM